MSEMIELKPCRECGAPCRIESFGPSEHIEGVVPLWICSKHKRFGGECPSDLAYFDADAWNDGVSAYNPNERLREAAKELLSRVDSFAREIAEPAFFSERETLRAALEAVK